VTTEVSLEYLFADLIDQTSQHSKKPPPVHLWDPGKTGVMDLRIDREGRWLHESIEIKKPAIVKLFASLLKAEERDYYLVSPTEKWQIQVDIAPLYIVNAERIIREDTQVISLSTSTDDHILLDMDHPLSMQQFNGVYMPIVTVRNNLKGLLSRAVFYQLVEWGISRSKLDGQREHIIESFGCEFSLGHFTP
jgi:hypothetical protein